MNIQIVLISVATLLAVDKACCQVFQKDIPTLTDGNPEKLVHTLETEKAKRTTCKARYSCLNCTTAVVCDVAHGGSSLELLSYVNCPTDWPWCNPVTHTCQSIQPATCAEPVSSQVGFSCMRDGLYPDPRNCSRYYYCQDGLASMYQCRGDYPYFRGDTQSCSTYSGYCFSQTACIGYAGRKLTINFSNKMFLYCIKDYEMTIDRCLDGHTFNYDAQTCLLSCPNRGLFPRYGDCGNYFKCSYATNPGSWSNLVYQNLTCPDGQGFSQTEYQCINRTMIPDCSFPRL